MIKRYRNTAIEEIWGDENKLALWLRTELAVIEARAEMDLISQDDWRAIQTLRDKPADIDWWKACEKETNHDLQAWVYERVRHLPADLRPHFHDGMTSFDTEEPAFASMLNASASLVANAGGSLMDVIRQMALRYRFTPMMGVTHGQAAEVQTFGKRCLTWWREIQLGMVAMERAREQLRFSKLSGAIGNYGGVTPEIEARALAKMGMLPFAGATQIMPRALYAPLAQALCQLVLSIDNISMAIRLGARTPRPIYQEPFGKKQTGSSRMPGKKNTITGEQDEGMGRMALGYLHMIMLNIRTWEERAIEQSSVERVAWPDLFHVTMQALKNITKVLSGLQVYPDNMLRDIIDTRGNWAAGPAKEFLRERLVAQGITTEDAYRMLQLAAFNAFEPSEASRRIRETGFDSIKAAETAMGSIQAARLLGHEEPVSIQRILATGILRVNSELDATEEQVRAWNKALLSFFSTEESKQAWRKVFSLQERLKDEDYLFQQILGV